MAVVGVDFGTLHSKIGVARHRGIDIIANEVSNRATPSLVAFGPKQRSIGESAKTQETSNFKNTIGGLNRLIGRTFDDPQVQNVEKNFTHAALVDLNGTIGVEVNYLGERQQFSFTQLVGAYLGKLRDITANELKTGVTDIVIAVPGYYTEIQRRAILDAAAIANLNVLRIINDTTATALGYGITKSDLPDPENPRHIAFVDVGHSTFSVAIVAFAKGQLTIKSTAYNHNLGGRDIDYVLLKHFAEEFKTKYKIDVLANPKATFRLAVGCEKLKKILSANAEGPLNIESIMNDVDASSKMSRDQLEALIPSLLDGIDGPIKQALAESGLTVDQIDSVELVGGSSRIPSVRTRISQAFNNKPLSVTLNQDEAVARGATFACAMLSPVFRVRDFHIHDINHYPVQVQWQAVPTDPDEDTEILLFPQGNAIPSTKILSFYRRQAFHVDAAYKDPSGLPGGIKPVIGGFDVTDVPPDPKGDSTIVKVKARLNLHGIVSFENTYVEEIEEREVEPAPMDVDQQQNATATSSGAAEGEAAPPVPPKKKKIVKKKEVPFFTTTSSLDKKTLEQLRERESEMHAADKLVQDTEDRKNALEEYIYDTRGKLDDRYAAFVTADEKSKLLQELSAAEDWLYTEEGEESTKSVYVSRLDALKTLGDPITFRYRETEDRQRSVAALRETLNNYMNQATSNDEKYAHIDVKDKESIVERVAVIQKWLDDMSVRQAERRKDVDPVLTSEQVTKKRDEIIFFATPILTKPKPKMPTGTTGTDSGTGTPKRDGTPQPPPPQKNEQEGGKDASMDVD
ncbi:hypothetical protein Agabi119p4_2327 [Agaricus bisporus var. burnettii]|uniref:Heat shock protein 70 n=1 Tax=Agaricus bisporus var. burnettii TaxID=192524 RepID=A0A8H7F8W0_AGABI|nr:hypothetical protein Agabi119p4_2327 [Agaricus bisporus var. burnettii]